MLTPEFTAQLDRASPRQRVTAILSWRKAQSLRDSGALLTELGRMKQPLLDRLESIAGVRVNPLPGMPVAIVEASAATWRNLLRGDATLRDADDVELVANRPDFHTQGAA
jgi:hypothetical protein